VPVLLTQADQNKGVRELVDALFRHRDFSRESGRAAARLQSGLRAEFLEVLQEEIGRRLEESLRHEGFASILRELEQGTLDPYQAALRAVESDETVQALRGSSAR
jgi:putative protein kinase ArgK-like GTPase of G3E family